jgi:hypothetical protein
MPDKYYLRLTNVQSQNFTAIGLCCSLTISTATQPRQ